MRYNYLDAARGVLISLGVVIHSAIIFSTLSWRVNSVESSTIFTYLVEFIHSFRMESFFIISGFFSMMIMEKKPINIFAKSRLYRLGIPLLFCSMFFNIIAQIISQPELLYDIIFWLGGKWVGHLWFLSNLILYSLFAALTIKYTPSEILSSIKSIKLPYVLFFIASICTLKVSQYIGWQLPKSPFGDKVILLNVRNFAYYGVYYAIGFVLYLNKPLQYSFTKKLWLNASIFLVFFILNLGFYKFKINLISDFVSLGFTFSLSALILSLFHRYCNKESQLSRNFSEASYSIYVLHQPIIVVLGTYLVKLDMNIYLSFLLISTPALLLPYYLHLKFISKNNLASILLNGKKRK